MDISALVPAMRFALATALLVALGAVTATAQAPAATVRVEVPATSSAWPLRFMVGVPAVVDLQPGDPCPLAVLHPETGEALPTRCDAILRRPDGSVRSLWIGALVPPGLEAGLMLDFEVIEEAQPVTGPALLPIVVKALSKPNAWDFRVRGIDGGVYLARFDPPAQMVRMGPLETMLCVSAPLDFA